MEPDSINQGSIQVHGLAELSDAYEVDDDEGTVLFQTSFKLPNNTGGEIRGLFSHEEPEETLVQLVRTTGVRAMLLGSISAITSTADIPQKYVTGDMKDAKYLIIGKIVTVMPFPMAMGMPLMGNTKPYVMVSSMVDAHGKPLNYFDMTPIQEVEWLPVGYDVGVRCHVPDEYENRDQLRPSVPSVGDTVTASGFIDFVDERSDTLIEEEGGKPSVVVTPRLNIEVYGIVIHRM